MRHALPKFVRLSEHLPPVHTRRWCTPAAAFFPWPSIGTGGGAAKSESRGRELACSVGMPHWRSGGGSCHSSAPAVAPGWSMGAASVLHSKGLRNSADAVGVRQGRQSGCRGHKGIIVWSALTSVLSGAHITIQLSPRRSTPMHPLPKQGIRTAGFDQML